jgi:molybdopterin molybdotransferase
VDILPLRRLLGRVVAEDIVSTIPLPPFDNSAVDGYGIAASETDRPVADVLRLVQRIPAGSASSFVVGSGEAVRLLTGAPVPEGVGAVVAEEHCRTGPRGVVLDRPLADGTNIRRRGEDVMPGTVIVNKGTFVDARHLAVLAAAGCTTVAVRRRIRVVLLSTGDELRDASDELQPGMIHDVNRPMLHSMLTKAWIDVSDFGICPDDPVRLARALTSATGVADVIITSGGASGSDGDHIGDVIADMGGAVWRHRLALKPGKPLIIGRLGSSIVLALPGNPVAAMVDLMLFGRPLLAAMAGAAYKRPLGQIAVCDGPFAHAAGRTEFVPVSVIGYDAAGRALVTRLGNGGSARLRPLILADGLAEIPAEVGDLSGDTSLIFHRFREELAIS